MQMTNAEYKKYTDELAPKSKCAVNTVKAFAAGGLICVIAQGIKSLYMQGFNIPEEKAGILLSITMIFIGALLTGLNIYDNLAKHAGAGSVVPITGFANAIVSPAMEFKSEGLVLGMSAKMFVIAGPVLVFGISAAIIYGLVLCLLV